jgi:hypothetical protein
MEQRRRTALFDRCATVLVVALGSASCSLDKSGTGTTDELVSDAGIDTDFVDSSVLDIAVDTTEPIDTFVPPDTSVDAFEAAVDARPPFCDASDMTLIGCYRFEGNGTDDSFYANNLTLTAGTFVSGVEGQALSFGPTTRATVAENGSLAVTTQLTIELWLRIRTLPTGSSRMGLVDDDGRFGLFVYPPGTARAQSPSPLDTSENLPTSTWTHVAYTFDGETMTMFVNGRVSSTLGAAASFGAASGNGLAVGGNSPSGDILDGDIDSLRIFRVARTPKQICEAAGATGC